MNVTALIRSDIERRNWDRLHVIADRRQPFMLGDGRLRRSNGEPVIVRSQVAG